ncbi:NUDIX hydrolase [Candidatus Dependentiae bacterium]|nr:NUDIX hydrolase [Candidatus Dependentiae bacterium]
MIRSYLINLLEEYASIYPEEMVFKTDMLDFIHKHTDCFERSLKIGHITASCWLLNNDATEALLMHHRKLDKWFQLGGHCDGNPDVLAVALKEAQEESGIEHIVSASSALFDIDIHLIPESSREQAHYHYDVRFLLQVASDEQVVQNQESKELRWIGKSRADLPTDNPSVVRMFNKWIALVGS